MTIEIKHLNGEVVHIPVRTQNPVLEPLNASQGPFGANLALQDINQRFGIIHDEEAFDEWVHRHSPEYERDIYEED